MAWRSRNKTDLMIEVWEKLDCESVGRGEIEAIETVVEGEFGKAAVDTPMRIARLLADEGAMLRHSEVMELHLVRVSEQNHYAALDDILSTDTLENAFSSIGKLEQLRRRYYAKGDKEGLRRAREVALEGKRSLTERIQSPKTDEHARQVAIEIAEWLSHWLQTPMLFADWVEMRQRSGDFIKKFGQMEKENKV